MFPTVEIFCCFQTLFWSDASLGRTLLLEVFLEVQSEIGEIYIWHNNVTLMTSIKSKEVITL